PRRPNVSTARDWRCTAHSVHVRPIPDMVAGVGRLDNRSRPECRHTGAWLLRDDFSHNIARYGASGLHWQYRSPHLHQYHWNGGSYRAPTRRALWLSQYPASGMP